MCDEETWHLYLLLLLLPVILLRVMRKHKRHCQQKQPLQCLLRHNLFSKHMSISHFVHLLFLSQVENHLDQAWKLRYEFVLLVSIMLLWCDTPKYAWKTGLWLMSTFTARGSSVGQDLSVTLLRFCAPTYECKHVTAAGRWCIKHQAGYYTLNQLSSS